MKKIKIFLVIIVIILACFILFKFSLEKNQSSKLHSSLPEEEPKPIEIIAEEVTVIPFGDNDGELGFKWIDKERGICIYPKSFDIDIDNNIYFLDYVNERISIFDKNGKFIENIYIGDKKYKEYNNESQIVKEGDFKSIAVGLDKKIYVSDGYSIITIYIKTKEFKIFKNEMTIGTIASLEYDKINNSLYYLQPPYIKFDKDLNFLGNIESTVYDSEGNFYKIEIVIENQYGGPLKLSKLNKERKEEKSVLLKNGMSSIVCPFFGIDKNNYIYILIKSSEDEKEEELRAIENGSSILNFYIYNNNLELIRVTRVEYKNYYKKHIPSAIFGMNLMRLHPDGTIYEFYITNDGVEIVKFKP